MARPGSARSGVAWQARRGKARHVQVGLGPARRGRRGSAGLGSAWLGTAGHGTARRARLGRACQGRVWRGVARPARLGGPGGARLGMAGMALARQGWAWLGVAWRGRRDWAWLGWARRGEAWLGAAGKAWPGSARRGSAWQGAAWRGMAGQARLGRARLGSAGHGLARRGLAGTEQGPPLHPTQRRAPGGFTRPQWSHNHDHARGFRMSREAEFVVDRLAADTILVPIRGTTPLIVHRWDDKAKRQMLDAQQGRKSVKQIRDPQADYEASLYRTPTGYGFPVLGFKAAIVSAARFYGKAVTMTSLRQCLFLTGVLSADGSQLLTPLEGEPKLREDMVRVGMGTDLRYRAEFPEWTAVLTITHVTTSLSQTSVLSLIDAAGMGVGVGEWRPEKRGQNGTFEIDPTRQIEVLSR